MLTSIEMPSQTLIELKFYPKIGKHVKRLHVKVQLNPTVGLGIMIVSMKLDSCVFYIRI